MLELARMDAVKDKTILIAESNGKVCETFSGALREDGFEVLTTDDGNKAAEILRSRRVDLVILDMELAGKSGYEIIKFMQTDEYRQIPVIATSGRFFKDTMQKFLQLESNVKECIIKPPNMNLLVISINNMLKTTPMEYGKSIKRTQIPAVDEVAEEEGEKEPDFWPVINIRNERLRKLSRIPSDISAEISDAGSGAARGSGRIADYSTGGVCLESGTDMAIGDEISVKTAGSMIALSFRGRIVYKKKFKTMAKYGLEFSGMDQREKEKLAEELGKFKKL
jgi:CheY-like chemotaxis protein